MIYDPDDPQADLYDVDDGEIDRGFEYVVDQLNLFVSESTVITLSDWYHYSSLEAPLVP